MSSNRSVRVSATADSVVREPEQQVTSTAPEEYDGSTRSGDEDRNQGDEIPDHPIALVDEVESTPALTPDMVFATAFEWDADLCYIWLGMNPWGISETKLDELFLRELAFWCQHNLVLMDECYRLSARFTIGVEDSLPFWDEVRAKDGTIYGELSIQKTLNSYPYCFTGKYTSFGCE